MQDAIGATIYTYDAANQLSSSTDPRSFAISYIRDANGNITKITYPGGKTVSYTYDAKNRIKTVTIDWLAKTTTYNYDTAGRMSDLTQFNGTYTRYTYDNANRLTALENRLTNGGSAIATYSYTLDANGNRTGSTQTVPIAFNVAAASTNFTMNTKKNRLTQAGTTAFTYDSEGQLATKTGETYTFDDAHRVASITGPNYTYRYDGAGNRLEATRNGVVTRYIYDANGNLLAEANSSNVIQKYYIYGDGLLAMVTSAGSQYCYHYDGTGNTVALTNATAGVVNKYAYTPFGKLANQQEGIAQPFKYVGKHGVMTEPNRLIYMRARFYDPSVGRFIQEDPKGFEGGDVNLMAYVLNNPINRTDPLGLWAVGANLEFSTINPFTSGGGGSYGLNLEYTSSSGWGLYTYSTPNNVGSTGLLVGPSFTLNAATGTGDWTGLFNSGAGSFGIITGGYFHSPPDQSDPGYFGLSLGLGKGPPGVGFTTTDYKKYPSPCK